MKTKEKKVKSINIITLGCSKNLVDSEHLLGQLKASNFSVYHESGKVSDYVIINTCGFIKDAKQESIEMILQYIQAKKSNLIKKIFVIGCLTERYKEELTEELPEVDGFFGVDAFPKILAAIGTNYKTDMLGERVITTPKHYAYLKISEGCNRKCSFCAIPKIRGKHISVSENDLLNEAKLLTSRGVKELILIAQDLTYYGYDIGKKRTLANLLEKLSDIEGVEWIRLQYAFPAAFPKDVLKVMNERKNICKYLDIPFQHINSRILRAMRRNSDSTDVFKLIDSIRNKVPDIALRTTLIAGYPGETKREFAELIDFVKKVKFDRLGVFAYSHEEGTYAYNFKDSVSSKTKESRVDEIMKIQQEISLELNRKKIGSTMKVLVDGSINDYEVGRTEFDSPEVDNEVFIRKGKKTIKQGTFVQAKIYDANEFDLYGDVII